MLVETKHISKCACNSLYFEGQLSTDGYYYKTTHNIRKGECSLPFEKKDFRFP